MKTSLATSTVNYPMAVNSSGNGCMYIFPGGVLGDGLSDAKSFISIINDNLFNPDTGIGGTSVKYPGPLYNSTSAVE